MFDLSRHRVHFTNPVLWAFHFVGFFLATNLRAQGYRIITEFVVTPTSGEFIEIYKPTSVTVVLSDYYLYNATFNSGEFYYQLVNQGGGGGMFFDFSARFPSGALLLASFKQSR